MPHNQRIMESAVRQLRTVWGALLISILLYLIVGERVPHPGVFPNLVLLEVFALVCVTMVVMIFVLRRIMVVKAAETLATRPDEPQALARWRGGYIVTLALCEAVALFGFVLRMQGFTLPQVAIFYLASAVLMIFLVPKRPDQVPA